jgi:hypothetical protein
MADKEKKPEAPHTYVPHNIYSSHTGLSHHFGPYNESVTFRDMKKKAEQAMTDHEFKD